MKADIQIDLNPLEVEDEKSNCSQKTFNLDNAKCKQGNSCVYLCFSSDCVSDAAMCNDLQCKCRSGHDIDKICSIGRLQSIVSKTEKKRVRFKNFAQWVKNKYDELIDWLSNEREQIAQQMEFYGLNQNQQFFLKCVYDGKCSKLTGKEMHNVVNNSCMETKQFDRLEKQIQEKISDYWPNCTQKIRNFMSSINQLVMGTYEKQFAYNVSLLAFEPSKIVTNVASRQTLIEMLECEQRAIKKCQLLYRASENNFEASKFWEKCDHKADTVTLIQTEKGRVIGGYTPLIWMKEKSRNYQSDPSLRSFVFSVTEKAKFTLKESKKQYAINHDKICGPKFGGGHDLSVSDNANSCDKSYINIGWTYEISESQQGKKVGWQSFQGSTTINEFKVKEWEVWQVVFS